MFMEKLHVRDLFGCSCYQNCNFLILKNETIEISIKFCSENVLNNTMQICEILKICIVCKW